MTFATGQVNYLQKRVEVMVAEQTPKNQLK